MGVYNKESKLSEALINHPDLIPVVNRLGIELGVGDKTFSEIAVSNKLDLDFFLSIINTFIDDEYFPSYSLKRFPENEIINYIIKTSGYYRSIQLPNIDRHISYFVEKSGSNNNLNHIIEFYYGIRKEFEEIIKKETSILEKSGGSFEPCFDELKEITEKSIEIEERISDLLTLFIVHLKGTYDKNLSTAVIYAIFSLQKDLRQNNRIRQRILLPLLLQKEDIK